MRKLDKIELNNEDSTSGYDIELFNLTKNYPLKQKNRVITALNNVSLKVKTGEVFGLLGPNGAGKTTLVSILTTLISPTSGYATILGYNILKEPWFIKENVGLMLGDEMIYYRLTGYKNLKFFSKLYNVKNYKEKINNLAEKFNLTKWLNQYVSSYSKGMKLKLALSRILLIDPKILFLDEPMLGLDPTSVNQVINILLNLNKTIFLTSHQMNVVEKLCDRIAFLKQGEILKIDTKENFKKLILRKKKIELRVINHSNQLINSLNKFDAISNISKVDKDITFYMESESFLPDLFNILKDFHVTKFNEIEPNLEEIFIKLSQKDNIIFNNNL